MSNSLSRVALSNSFVNKSAKFVEESSLAILIAPIATAYLILINRLIITIDATQAINRNTK